MTYEQWINQFIEKTLNNPVKKIPIKGFLAIIKKGKDKHGNKVIDQYISLGVSTLIVELKNNKWQCYLMS